MNYRKLDEVLMTICSELDRHSNRWWYFYQLTTRWLEDVHDSRIGGIPAQVRFPVEDGRVWLPQDFSVGMIGVDVNGSISPLLENPRMIDALDECGRLTVPAQRDTQSWWWNRTATGNPDMPAINIGRADVRMSTLPLWPGQGGGKSARGYYRHFREKNYIKLDESCTYTEIFIEGATSTFQPGYVTWIATEAKEAIMAWIVWQPLEMRKSVNPSLTRAADDARREYIRAMKNLRAKKKQEPLAMMVAAVQSSYGQIGL